MKKSILIIFAFLYSLNVNADQTIEIPDFLEGSWSQASREDERDFFSFKRTYNLDKVSITYTEDNTRQVGGDDTPNYPYETVCRFRQISTLTRFSRASDNTKAYYKKNGKEEPTYEFSYNVNKVVLLPALYNSPNCKFFIADMQQKASEGNLNYTQTLRDLSDTVTLDSWYNTVFEKQ